jgi:hypothetical protein
MKDCTLVHGLHRTTCFCHQFIINKIRISDMKDTVMIIVLLYGSDLSLNIFTSSAFMSAVM